MSAKAVVKGIVQVDVKLRVPRHVSSNVQVLVDNNVRPDVDKHAVETA